MANTAKTAIVTGASRGIGAGLVEAFLKRGYNVVANSRHITKANAFAASSNLALVDGDIGDRNTAAKIVDTAVSKFGRIDVLINNAGVFIPKPFTEYTTEDFNKLQHFSLHDACRLSLRVTARRKANVAAEIGQYRQHLNNHG
jgi:NAD(P)-dependent dehydrogenase (short-subunit alcohol dehydrogenase family)